jgi:hypothetical protein
MAIFGQIALEEPEPPSRRRAGVDAELEAICLKALAKKPQERFPSMAAFAAALTVYAKSHAAEAAPVAKPVFAGLETASIRLPEQRSRLPLAAGIAAAVLLAVATLLVATVFRPKPAKGNRDVAANKPKAAEPPGAGPDGQRTKRKIRWTINFNTRNGDDYLRQFHACGAILAFKTPEGELKAVKAWLMRPTQLADEDQTKSDRIVWIDDKRESLMQVAPGAEAGVRPGPTHRPVPGRVRE